MYTQLAIPVAGAVIVGFIIRGVILGKKRRKSERELIYLKFEIIEKVVEIVRNSPELSPAYRTIALKEAGNVFHLLDWQDIYVNGDQYHVVQPLWKMLCWLTVKANPLLVRQADRVEGRIRPHQDTSHLFDLLRMQEMDVPCIRWLSMGINKSTAEKFPELTRQMTEYRVLEKRLGSP